MRKYTLMKDSLDVEGKLSNKKAHRPDTRAQRHDIMYYVPS